MSLVDAIPQTIKEIGRINAQGRAASGAYGTALADIGSMVATIPAQIQAKKIQDQQMQIRQQELETGALTLQQKKRDMAASQALDSAMAQALAPDGTIDPQKLTQHLAGTPAASKIPDILQHLTAMQKSTVDLKQATLNVDESERDEMGSLAAAAEAAGDDADTQAGVLLTGIASRVKRGRMTQEDATPIISGLMADVGGEGPSQPDPEKVKATIARMKTASKEQRTLAATDAQKRAAAESAEALAEDRKAQTEQRKVVNYARQLAGAENKAIYTRIYQGVPPALREYFDAPEAWTPESSQHAADVTMTPAQVEQRRHDREAEQRQREADAETKRYHTEEIAARDRATAARVKAAKDPSNIENVRAYEQFLSVWDRTYPKLSNEDRATALAEWEDAHDKLKGEAKARDVKPSFTAPTPPSLEKWTVMTPAERQRVISEPGSRITDAEMARRLGGAPAARPQQTAPVGAVKMKAPTGEVRLVAPGDVEKAKKAGAVVVP